VAFKARAQSTLATLWSVNDEASAAFTQESYGNLAKPGTTRAEALRQAQLALLQSRDCGHPLYWAAYVLLGSWL
jgi:CHAT domain-containing protein